MTAASALPLFATALLSTATLFAREEGPLTYRSGSGGIIITACEKTAAGDITIPSTIDGRPIIGPMPRAAPS
ncbi:hypothetical protein BH23VER1_BH23VER1_29800 [soil metagenome]